MNRTVEPIDVLRFAKNTLIVAVKTLISQPDKCINEESIRRYLTEQCNSRDDANSKIPDSEEVLDLIIQDFFTLSARVQYLETAQNTISIRKLPYKDQNKALHVVLQEVEKIFDSLMEKLNLVADKSPEDLPEDWIPYDSNPNTNLSGWAKEISEMQERIHRRRMGEKFAEE